VNSRLAEAWEDPSMRAVKLNVIADRAEAYPLRVAPLGVCKVIAGVDTQDNRLAVQIIGMGKGTAIWVLDYIELMGDPADDAVWVALTDLLNRPIEHINGHALPIEATAIDAGGHRTEAVKDFVRRRMIRRPMVIFGAVPNNAPVLSKPKAQDVNWRGQYNKRGVMIQHVGTVAVKNKLFGRMATDGDKPKEARLLHFSEDLPKEYFTGIVSETFNPAKNRFEKKRGARNEPLDTLVYAYAAAHHHELRLHLYTAAKWEEQEAKLAVVSSDEYKRLQQQAALLAQQPQQTKPSRNNLFIPL
ncbi:MAG: terminase gpA endonuclease subunit, partial [Methylobacter sp.]